MKPISLAMTGASGAQYGLRLMDCLLQAGCTVHLMVSKAALLVIATETDMSLPPKPEAMRRQLCEHYGCSPEQLQVYGREDWMAPVASGSGAPGSMVVCPASTGTLSAIACGASNNLIERAADVVLKERRQLILVTREMPLSSIHLQHMLTLSQMGATIMPASPGFYRKPQSVDDVVDFVVARVLDHLGIEQKLVARWGE
jgi:4-hydroxy-3-polyprenylbenzoate decarboxylase